MKYKIDIEKGKKPCNDFGIKVGLKKRSSTLGMAIVLIGLSAVFVSGCDKGGTDSVAEIERGNATELVEYDVLANVEVKLKKVIDDNECHFDYYVVRKSGSKIVQVSDYQVSPEDNLLVGGKVTLSLDTASEIGLKDYYGVIANPTSVEKELLFMDNQDPFAKSFDEIPDDFVIAIRDNLKEDLGIVVAERKIDRQAGVKISLEDISVVEEGLDNKGNYMLIFQTEYSIKDVENESSGTATAYYGVRPNNVFVSEKDGTVYYDFLDLKVCEEWEHLSANMSEGGAPSYYLPGYETYEECFEVYNIVGMELSRDRKLSQN